MRTSEGPDRSNGFGAGGDRSEAQNASLLALAGMLDEETAAGFEAAIEIADAEFEPIPEFEPQSD